MRRSAAWGGALCLAGALLLAVAWLLPAHRDDPAALAGKADASLRLARSVHAERWAPMNLSQAEDAYASGLVERRRQQLRMTPFRRYEVAERLFAVARDRADVAVRLTSRSREALERHASTAVSEAATEVGRLDGIENVVWMGSGLRSRLGRARALAREARTLLSGSAPTRSRDRAWEAKAEALAVADSVRVLAARYSNPESLAGWRAAVMETRAWSRRTGRSVVVVFKDEHRASLYEAGILVRSFRAELGWNNLVNKVSRGDGATPEGRYRIVLKKGSGQSKYHLALLLDYPNAADRKALAEAKREGRLPHTARAGGLIEIHGGGGRGHDWTDGCVSVTDGDIDELFAHVRVGTPVTIVGSGDGGGQFSTLARKLAR